MKKIKLHGKYGKGKFALVDNSDYKAVKNIKWFAQISLTGAFYARKMTKEQGKITALYLHHLVAGINKGKEVDHINNNTLDNRRSNLRVCSHSQNLKNRKLNKNSTSGFKGVILEKTTGKWRASIFTNKQRFHLGTFKVKKEAALAYDEAAKKLFGEFARINFN